MTTKTTKKHPPGYTPPSAMPDEPKFTDGERNAMRAYLQRCEVRLSTLHRIATAFVGGAGLMLLIPVFLRDAIDSMIEVMLAHMDNQFAPFGEVVGSALTGALFLLVLYPFVLSLVIPLYGVYLLLKDIVHFYFTLYMPGFPPTLLNPTFALTGVMFSQDESPAVKEEVMRYQYMPTRMDYMLPFSRERRELYFDTVIENTEGDIIPESRDLNRLREMGVLTYAIDADDVQRFNAALGIARSLDRTLAQEVAVTEMALVRHVLYLRRLVLRYVKTLLMFLWTTFIAFLMLPFLQDDRFPTFVVLSVGYLAWALAVMPIMKLPLSWIYRHRYGDLNPAHIDPQLTLLQQGVQKYCQAAVVSAVLAVAMATAAYLASR
jgi:hypothetical protein